MSSATEATTAAAERADAATSYRSPSVRPADYHRWKSLIGRVLATLLLVPGLPIIGLLVLIVRLTSPGPGIYRQVRVGRHGKTFSMYKIRTMRSDAETKSGPAWTQKNDPRVTRIGRVLRKLHLDEFPQLFNVLKGEMALIGPRPERPEFTQVLAREIPGYMDRVLVLPGITGLAQINLPPDTDLNSVRRKLVLDLEYVRTASALLDVRMIACTLLRMLGMRGEFAMRLMLLDRTSLLKHLKCPTEGDSREHATPASLVAAATQPSQAAVVVEDDADDAASATSRSPDNERSSLKSQANGKTGHNGKGVLHRLTGDGLAERATGTLAAKDSRLELS